MLVLEPPAPGTGCAQPSAGCCTATPACMRAMWSSGSGCRCARRNSYSSSAHICCCTPVEPALRCCCSCCCLDLSIDGPHPGQAAGLPHLLCTLLPHKLDLCEVSPSDAGSTTYKDMLSLLAPTLCWCLSFSPMVVT